MLRVTKTLTAKESMREKASKILKGDGEIKSPPAKNSTLDRIRRKLNIFKRSNNESSKYNSRSKRNNKESKRG